MIKHLFSAFLLATPVVATAQLAQLAGPINACTIYDQGFNNFFDRCARFKVQRGHGCRKKKCFGPVCKTYDGDKLSMYLPDYFIEVTPHLGRSLFTEGLLKKPLETHLKLGLRYWDSVRPPGPSTPRFNNNDEDEKAWNQASQSGGYIDEGMQVYNVRIIGIPGASAVTLYPADIYPLFKSATGGIPACYEAISEMIPSQWRDNKYDGVFAMATSSISYPLCNSTKREVVAAAGLIQGAIAEVGGVFGGLDGDIIGGLSANCSYPVPSALVRAKMLSPRSELAKSVVNPLNLCIGSFGEKFPRTNTVLADDEHSAAVIAAVRFASLASDSYGVNSYRIGPDDKIQQVYPKPTAPECYRPGNYAEALAMTTEPITALPAMLREDAPYSETFVLAEDLKGTYVFAVWKKRSSCQEPFGKTFWNNLYKAQRSFNKGLCNM